MSKKLWKLLMFFALCGFAGCAVMTVMAVSFHEWGRVLFYGLIGLLCAELFVFGILKLKET